MAAQNKTTSVPPELLAAARQRAAQARQQFANKPGPAELLTSQELADATPFYFALRDYIRQLKEAREAAGLTLADVSARTGMAVESLSRLETGAQTNPTWKTLAAYAAAVGRRPRLTAKNEKNERTATIGSVLSNPESSQFPANCERDSDMANKWQSLIPSFDDKRAYFIDKALAESKKCCPAPTRLSIGHDQNWLEIFSQAQTVEPSDVENFLREFSLSRWASWDYQAVANLILLFRGRNYSDASKAVSALVGDLSRCTKEGRREISAASKIACFTKPLYEVYIWDTNAKASASFRNRRNRQSASFPDYTSFSDSCAKILEEENQKADFLGIVDQFKIYLQQVGGPMADNAIAPDSFIRRRVLDKLMFFEGEWLIKKQKRIGSSTKKAGGKTVPTNARGNPSPSGTGATTMPTLGDLHESGSQGDRMNQAILRYGSPITPRKLAELVPGLRDGRPAAHLGHLVRRGYMRKVSGSGDEAVYEIV